MQEIEKVGLLVRRGDGGMSGAGEREREGEVWKDREAIGNLFRGTRL
jgi:hypothetical protein